MLSYASNAKQLELGIQYSHDLPIFVKVRPVNQTIQYKV